MSQIRSDRRRDRALAREAAVDRVWDLLAALNAPPEPEVPGEYGDRLECGCAPWRQWWCVEHWRVLPRQQKDALKSSRGIS
jgi:hypothetical protein